MRHILAAVVMGAMLALTTSAALAFGPSVDGTVNQKFTNTDGGTALIAIDGTPYAVPFDFYSRVQIGDTVQFDGTNWTIVSNGSK